MSEAVQIALVTVVGGVIMGLITQIPAIILARSTARSLINKLEDTRVQMAQLEKNTNSNTEKLVLATKVLAHTMGRAEGVAEATASGESTAVGVAAEVARAVVLAKEESISHHTVPVDSVQTKSELVPGEETAPLQEAIDQTREQINAIKKQPRSRR